MNLAALIVGILTVVFTVDDVSAEVNVGKLNVGNIKQELLCNMNITDIISGEHVLETLEN